MKTPLPEPVQAVCVMVSNIGSTHMTPKGNYYTSKQLRAAMVAAYEEGVEEAAKACEGMKVRAVRSSYEAPAKPWMLSTWRPQHITSKDCWCNPEVAYVDPDTGVTVYVHKEIQ